MIRTRAGYCGGTTPNPNYDRIGNHTETFQVDYDPRVISYSDLLAVFWCSHATHVPAISEQYKAAVFYSDDYERELAEASKRELEQSSGRPVATEILPLKRFYRAEDYHQKYYLRGHRSLMKELRTLYPDDKAFADSTLAARLNAYVGGHGFAAVLERELASYGLSEQVRAYVHSLAPDLDEGQEGGAACGLVQHEIR